MDTNSRRRIDPAAQRRTLPLGPLAALALATLGFAAAGCSCAEDPVIAADDGGAGLDAGRPRPNARAETCGNGMDDDRDGRIDDGCPCAPGETQACFGGDYPSRDVGLCRDGVQTCDVPAGREWGDWGDHACEGSVLPAEEQCDGLDHDCDGMPDEGCPCTAGETRPCGESFPSVPPCRQGTQRCDAAGTWSSTCEGAVGPSAERCDDGVDNDCDGTTDPASLCDCAPVPEICANGVDDDCDGSVDEPGGCTPTCIPVAEVCGDGVDQDCDGADAACPDAGVDACVPQTCASVAGACGTVDDGCGGTIDCGPCPVACTSTPMELHRAVIPTTLVFADGRHAQMLGDSVILNAADMGREQLLRVPLDGSAVTVLTSAPFIGDFAVATDFVYFEGDNSIQRVPVTGGFPSTIFTTPSLSRDDAVKGMVTDGAHLWAITVGASEATSDPGILRIRTSDGTFTRIAECTSPTAFGCATLRRQGTTLTWRSFVASAGADRTWTFEAMSDAGGPVTDLADYTGFAIHESAQGPADLYIAGYLEGQILRAPLAGGASTTLRSGAGVTTGRLLRHRGDLLFSALSHPSSRYGQPGIYAVPVTGGAPRRLVSPSFGHPSDDVRLFPIGVVGDCLVYAENAAVGTSTMPPPSSIRIVQL